MMKEAKRLSSYKVLVVEDDFATGELLKEILEQNGYQVVIKTDGLSALKTVGEEKYDLAMVDVMLPTLNGFEICERIRDDPQNELLPIIILTVLTESQHRIRALQAGATSFLNKPFDRIELLTQIHSLITLTHKMSQREHFDDIVFCLQTMLGIRSPDILAHSQRVAKLAEQLAFRIGLSLSIIDELKTGALLHDIGKLCLDIPINASNNLSKENLAVCQRHTDFGDRMFSRFHRPVIRSIIKFHHEHCFAASFPGPISDNQIRLSVQIVAVCNRFDNLIQANAQDQNAIQHALLLLGDEVKANCWDREVYAKLAELTKTFGNGLFTVFAP
jgi:putative two-component system response regulator